MNQYKLNPTGAPGSVIDMACLQDEITVLRCCLAKEMADYTRKQLYGSSCSPSVFKDIRLRQIALDKLTCIDFDHLDEECLTEPEIVSIIQYLQNKCTTCNVWSNDLHFTTATSLAPNSPGASLEMECPPYQNKVRNQGFDSYNRCPTTVDQVHNNLTLLEWVNASTGSTIDYLNTCGFVYSSGVTPASILNAGGGMVALFTSKNIHRFFPYYIEYVGQCLTTPLANGTDYKLTISIATALTGMVNSKCAPQDLPTTPIDFTLWGNPDCNALPWDGGGCPTDGQTPDPTWINLGTVPYTAGNNWQDVSISFTPGADIATIALGGPCAADLPADWTLCSTCTSRDCYPRLFLDNVRLCTL